MTKIIDAALFAEMIISGANNLSNNRETVDALNVFPVPDGDTGTNMSLTFINAARNIENRSFSSLSEAAEVVSKATLRGARGNSGVILSQIFRGIYKSLSGKDTADMKLFADALKLGSDTAYRAVMKPTEGTILTVIRAISEAAASCDSDEAEDFFAQVIAGGNSALSKTPEMLPQLKQAGVVDAGGQGLMLIFEGFLSALTGNPVVLSDSYDMPATNVPAQQAIRTEDIKFAYCTEFIINKFNANISAAKMRNAIAPKGDSMIVIDEDDIVKVHIHTNHPGFVLEQAIKLGELVNIKIENMKEQHTDILNSATGENSSATPISQPKKEIGIVCVASGSGLESVFTDLGADKIILGGQTMNPSTEDILSAVNEINAEKVIVLPNNKNIILAAEQAQYLTDCKLQVIPSKTIPQGIAALMAYSAVKTFEENTKAMEKALSSVKSGSVTVAVKDTTVDDKEIAQGNFIGVSDGRILSVSESIHDSALALVSEIADDDSEIITLYYGSEITENDAQALSDAVEEVYPDADVIITNGGQPVYYYLISVE